MVRYLSSQECRGNDAEDIRERVAGRGFESRAATKINQTEQEARHARRNRSARSLIAVPESEDQ